MERENFNLERFNKEFASSERLALDYVYKTIIKKIPNNFNEFTKNKAEIRNYYLLTLWNSASLLNDCLWLYEEFSFDNNFNFDTYSSARDKLYEELGLIYNLDAEKWEYKKVSV